MEARSVTQRGIALVAAHIRLHPGPFVVSVAGAALFAACTVLATVVLGRVADEVVIPLFETGEPGAWTLRTGVAASVSVALLRVVGVLGRRYFASITSERVQSSLRYQLVDQYLGLPLSWHQETPAGQLLAHADNDTEVATNVLHPLPFSIGVIFMALFSGISLIAVDLQLALVAFLVFPALVVFNRIYTRSIEEPAALVQAGVGEVSTVAHESFDGALVVRTLGRAEAESERFDAVAERLFERRVRVGYLRTWFDAILDSLPNVGIVVVLIVGAYRVDAGAVRPGELVQVASLFSALAFPIRILGFFLESLPPSVVAKDRLDGVFDEALPRPVHDPSPVPAGPLSLEVSNLDFSYGRSDPVLVDVTFTIGAGEVVALVGSTGVGKSTLVHVVAGLIPPNRGSIGVSGVPLEKFVAVDRAAAIGLVFQESFLFADSIRNNIDLQGSHTLTEVEHASKIASADGFICDMPNGYDTIVGERGVTLSGGQRQRVALARALLQRPQLLILDDATSAVDAKVEQQILAALGNALDMTTLVVAQRVSTIQLADRVVYLQDGRVAGAGSHSDLLRLPAYRDLVTAYEQADS